jgi:hypothetical protein
VPFVASLGFLLAWLDGTLDFFSMLEKCGAASEILESRA